MKPKQEARRELMSADARVFRTIEHANNRPEEQKNSIQRKLNEQRCSMGIPSFHVDLESPVKKIEHSKVATLDSW